MFAAVVSSFDRPPRYVDYPEPMTGGRFEAVVEVLAAGLHPRVRSQADGSHYTSTGALPLVPGVDGVGRLPDGTLTYFVLPDTTMGSLAERTVIDTRRSVTLAPDSDPVLIAAGMNPAMSSWVALRRRIDFARGMSVLVLGATGSAGQLAVQVADHLGAGRVVAAGRNQTVLDSLTAFGADELVSLAGDGDAVAARLGAVACDVDVVIDYLWGPVTAGAVVALLTRRADLQRALHWIEIGSVAGDTMALPSAALRSANLRMLGSGQGSAGTGEILAELPALVEALDNRTLTTNAEVVALSDIEEVWTAPAAPGRRIVVTPRGV